MKTCARPGCGNEWEGGAVTKRFCCQNCALLARRKHWRSPISSIVPTDHPLTVGARILWRHHEQAVIDGKWQTMTICVPGVVVVVGDHPTIEAVGYKDRRVVDACDLQLVGVGARGELSAYRWTALDGPVLSTKKRHQQGRKR